MVDDLRSDDGLGGFESHHRLARRPEKERPLADREVPLGYQENDSRILPPTVHRWLDGELPEASVRRGDTARDVEFWKNISVEAERRRRMNTPPHLEAQIMEALPQTAPAVITPWYKREFVITPARAVALGAGLMLIAAAAATVVMAAMH